MNEQHSLAGRMCGASGCVSFCTCGLAFFAGYEGAIAQHETSEQRRDAVGRADELLSAHEKMAQDAESDHCGCTCTNCSGCLGS